MFDRANSNPQWGLSTRHVVNVPSLSFKHFFFPSAISECNKLDPSLRNSASYNVLKNNILKFVRPSPNKIFKCHNPKGIKLVKRLRLGLNLNHALNPLCKCCVDIETASQYFHHCPLYMLNDLLPWTISVESIVQY